MAFVLPSWKNRGRNYSEFGIFLRCVRADQTTTVCTLSDFCLSAKHILCLKCLYSYKSLILHYLSNGNVMLSFSYAREQFFLPIFLVMRVCKTGATASSGKLF